MKLTPLICLLFAVHVHSAAIQGGTGVESGRQGDEREESTKDILRKIAEVNQIHGFTPRTMPTRKTPDKSKQMGYPMYQNPIFTYLQRQGGGVKTTIQEGEDDLDHIPKGHYIKRKITHKQTYIIPNGLQPPVYEPQEYNVYYPEYPNRNDTEEMNLAKQQFLVNNIKSIIGGSQYPQGFSNVLGMYPMASPMGSPMMGNQGYNPYLYRNGMIPGVLPPQVQNISPWETNFANLQTMKDNSRNFGEESSRNPEIYVRNPVVFTRNPEEFATNPEEMPKKDNQEVTARNSDPSGKVYVKISEASVRNPEKTNEHNRNQAASLRNPGIKFPENSRYTRRSEQKDTQEERHFVRLPTVERPKPQSPRAIEMEQLGIDFPKQYGPSQGLPDSSTPQRFSPRQLQEPQNPKLSPTQSPPLLSFPSFSGVPRQFGPGQSLPEHVIYQQFRPYQELGVDVPRQYDPFQSLPEATQGMPRQFGPFQSLPNWNRLQEFNIGPILGRNEPHVYTAITNMVEYGQKNEDCDEKTPVRQSKEIEIGTKAGDVAETGGVVEKPGDTVQQAGEKAGQKVGEKAGEKVGEKAGDKAGESIEAAESIRSPSKTTSDLRDGKQVPILDDVDLELMKFLEDILLEVVKEETSDDDFKIDELVGTTEPTVTTTELLIEEPRVNATESPPIDRISRQINFDTERGKKLQKLLDGIKSEEAKNGPKGIIKYLERVMNQNKRDSSIELEGIEILEDSSKRSKELNPAKFIKAQKGGDEKILDKANSGSGIFINRLKVRKGGVAIAGPGGIATAGNGGTAIVGPNGVAYTQPNGVAIAGPGSRVIAVDPGVDLNQLVQNLTRNDGSTPRLGRVVAVGPVVYYNKGEEASVGV